MSMLVRIKPYSPKKGYVLRSYTYGGNRFQEGRGWYEVDDATAAYLKEVKQRSEDPDSHDAFDVCTEAEARAIEAREAKAKTVATADEPVQAGIPKRIHAPAAPPKPKPVAKAKGVLTTEDLAPPPTPNKSASFDHDEDAGDDGEESVEDDDRFDDGPVDPEPEVEEGDEEAEADEPPPAKASSKPAKGGKRK